MIDRFQLTIITPEREFFRGESTFVEFTTTDGDVGVYPGHVPTTVVLDPGVLRIHNGKEKREAALHSGFAEILPDKITILAEAVEWPEEIEIERVKQKEAAAREAMLQKRSVREYTLAEASLKRAISRMKIKDGDHMG